MRWTGGDIIMQLLVYADLGVKHKSSYTTANDVGVDGRSSPRETTDDVSSSVTSFEGRIFSRGLRGVAQQFVGSFSNDDGSNSLELKSARKKLSSSSESDTEHTLLDLGRERKALSESVTATDGLLR
jgi:hypothetical protein